MHLYRFAPVVLAATLSACAAPASPSSSTPAFSQTDAQNLAANFASAANNGATAGNNQLSTRSADAPRVLSPFAWRARPDIVSCTSDGSSCSIFQSYSQTTSCNGGGRISVAGTISGTLSAGIGNIGLQQTDSVVDWACEGGWIVNGDPHLSDIGGIVVTGDHSSFTFHEGGGFVATSTSGGARVSCQVSVGVQWDNALGGSFTGTDTCSPGGTFSVHGSF